MHQSEVGPFVSKARALITELGKECKNRMNLIEHSLTCVLQNNWVHAYTSLLFRHVFYRSHAMIAFLIFFKYSQTL